MSCSEHPFEAAWQCPFLGDLVWDLHKTAALQQVALLVVVESLYWRLDMQLGCVSWCPGDKQGTIWVHLKSCCREERNIMGLHASGCPREGEGSREDQTAPTQSTASHLCPKTSWAAITEQERFVSLA